MWNLGEWANVKRKIPRTNQWSELWHNCRHHTHRQSVLWKHVTNNVGNHRDSPHPYWHPANKGQESWRIMGLGCHGNEDITEKEPDSWFLTSWTFRRICALCALCRIHTPVLGNCGASVARLLTMPRMHASYLKFGRSVVPGKPNLTQEDATYRVQWWPRRSVRSASHLGTSLARVSHVSRLSPQRRFLFPITAGGSWSTQLWCDSEVTL